MMDNEPSKGLDRILSAALIWRLAQIVLVLAAAYLFFLLSGFGAELQAARASGWPHTANLIKAILVGIGMGLCIGLALKDLSTGRIAFVADWPTFLINLLAAAVFALVAVSFSVSSLFNLPLVQGPLGAAVVNSPLLPWVWIGLALTSFVRAKAA